MSASTSVTHTPAGVRFLASVSHNGGTLSAMRMGTGKPRVTFNNQWSEVSYPMLTHENQQAWDEVVSACNALA